MDRNTRIKIVRGFAASFALLILACVVFPMVAAFSVAHFSANSAGDMQDALTRFSQIALALQIAIHVSLALSLVSFASTAIILGNWFVNSAPLKKATESSCETEPGRYLQTE